MMDLIPELIDGAVVLNLTRSGECTDNECRDCLDIGGIMHNWLMGAEMRYLIIDLQDEKDVCPTFLIEMLQLRKRLRTPMLFAGVMEKARRVLNSYNYTAANLPLFGTPEDAIRRLKDTMPELMAIGDVTQVGAGEPIAQSRISQGLRSGGDVSLDEAADSADL